MIVSIFLTISTIFLTICQSTDPGIYDKSDGDFNIGLVLPIHRPSHFISQPYNPSSACGDLDESQMMQATYFISLIESINENQNLLPNVTLGYSIIDSCSLPNMAIMRAFNWGPPGIGEFLSNLYSSDESDEDEDNDTSASMENGNKTAVAKDARSPVAFVVGGYNSRVSLPLAMYLQVYKIPFIDTGATLGDLSDRRRYPLYARSSPSDKHQAAALAEMAQRIGHSCIHLVYSAGLYGEMGADDLRVHLRKLGICIVSDQKAPTFILSTSSDTFAGLVDVIRDGADKSQGVVCFCEDSTVTALMAAMKLQRRSASKVANVDVPRFNVIASDYWQRSMPISHVLDIAEGAITLSVGLPPNATTGISVTPEKLLEIVKSPNANPWVKEFFENRFSCKFTEKPEWYSCHVNDFYLASGDVPVDDNAERMYTSLLAGVQGLQATLRQACPSGDLKRDACSKFLKKNPEKLYDSITSQTVDVSLFGHPPFTFDANGEGNPMYTFYNIQLQRTEAWFGNLLTRAKYVPLAVWTKGKDTAIHQTAMGQAKNWPRTDEPIAVNCTCPAATAN